MADKSAYNHSNDVAGAGGDPAANAETEHRDTVDKGLPRRNELQPDQRNEEPGPARTTHDDTRFTRKDGGRS